MINVLEDAGSHKPSPTCLALRMLKHIQSPPTWGRGLKPIINKALAKSISRPPRGGVD